MAGRECYHCKQWIEAGEPHNCWSTTEAALTAELPLDLREAWERLRETAADLGEQRIYASLNSIMFSRKACYCFVRPKTRFLEVCFFLGRTITAPQIKRATAASRQKVAHLVQVRHRDEVEAPLTDWIREAYETSDALSGRPGSSSASTPTVKQTKKKANPAAAKRKKATTPVASRKKTTATPASRKKKGRTRSRGGVP